jgi:Domain of unknown function (DUF4287)
MSFQAYLDNIEAKTGKTPNEFVALAKQKGLDAPDTKAGAIVDWLKQDYCLGRGHAMALVHVIKHGAQISEKHVGSDGVHRDESSTLRLGGKTPDRRRSAAPSSARATSASNASDRSRRAAAPQEPDTE